MEDHLIEKQQPDEAPWTIQQTFLGIIITVVPWVLLTIALNAISGKPVHNTPLSPQADLTAAIITFIFSSLVEAAFLIAPLYFALRAFHSLASHTRLAFQALGFRRFNASIVLSWIVLLLIAILGANFLYSYLIQTFHLPLQTNDQLILMYSKNAPLTTYATLLVAVVVAPICEEVFFRGFVFPGLLHAMSPVWAIILSALIFAVAHGDPGSFAVLFLIGLALAFLRWRTKSIWPGIMLHALNNGVAALAIIVAMQGRI
jgi:membrane protease YdiL (CAAX protease family)